jgi:predicted lipid-binding transport protein (Tim44 family)
MNRSMTTPGQATPRAQNPQTAGGGFFNRGGGFLGGLAAGFLGAGLLGMLFGGGLLGGLGGFASIIGLVLQVALVVIVGRLLWSWWQRRNAPAYAGPTPRDQDTGYGRTALGAGLGGGLGGGSSAGGGAPLSSPQDNISIGSDDYDAFERLLKGVQTAYGQEDLAALRKHATPEMVSYFADDLASNASRGVRNEISDVELRQGDLAEAWREGDTDYATVAMKFGLNDRMVDRNSGRVVEGGPTEATELWTFRRGRGGDWIVSAIQQA